MSIHYCYLSGLYSRYDPIFYDRQAKSLIRAGFKVTIIACDKIKDEDIEGIVFRSCNWIPKSRFQRMMFSSKYLFNKAIQINADIYQISEPELLFLGIKLKKRGKRVIFNLREDYPALIKLKEYIPKALRGIVARYVKLQLKRKLIQYDYVIPVTDDLENTLKKWNIQKSIVITNFPNVDKEIGNFSEDEYMARQNILCYYGTIYKFSYQKNIFRAIENLTDIKYHLAGILEDSASLMSDPYWPNVIFTGKFNYPEMKNILRNATISNILKDFTLLGTQNGSYGVVKMFESMQAGLPIICPDVNINREIINKYKCGICVNINNIDGIHNAVKYLIEHKKEAYYMGQNGRKAVLTEYNWQKQSVKYINIIKSLYKENLR